MGRVKIVTSRDKRKAPQKTPAKRPVAIPTVEMARIAELKPHPQNYRAHPDDQIQHLTQSLTEHGIYRNIVVARDGTILAGHGVVQAAQKMGLDSVPVIRLNVAPGDAGAIKVLIGDNEIEHLAENNDRLLTELLKSVQEDGDLLGTGYDEMMLANLLMVTRPESEIKDFDAAAAWAGLPEYDSGGNGLGNERPRVIVHFADEAKREEWVKAVDLRIDSKNERVWVTRWPWTERADKGSIRFAGKKPA